MQLITVLVLYCILSTEASSANNEIWSTWKQMHGKTYQGQLEEEVRKRQFEINLDVIAQHNLKHDVGLESFTMRLNKFSDLSRDEFKEIYLGKFTSRHSVVEEMFVTDILSIEEINAAPESVDWREKGLVTKIKDQGQCGSSWAFSTTGAVEGQYTKMFNKSMEFSEQQLVDCDHVDGGCIGGLMILAFDYIKSNGIEAEDSYPYTAQEGVCSYSKEKVVVNITSYKLFPSRDEEALKAAVAKYGPISGVIYADSNFQAYSGGIFSSATCSSVVLNYSVLIVGYGHEKGQDYWIVKSSMGSDWGEEGYIRIARNKSNMCEIATLTSVPFL